MQYIFLCLGIKIYSVGYVPAEENVTLSGGGLTGEDKLSEKTLIIGLSYQPARLHSLEELVLWNRCLGSFKVKKFGHWVSDVFNWNPSLPLFDGCPLAHLGKCCWLSGYCALGMFL